MRRSGWFWSARILTAAGEVHRVCDCVISVDAQRDQHVRRWIRDDHLKTKNKRVRENTELQDCFAHGSCGCSVVNFNIFFEQYYTTTWFLDTLRHPGTTEAPDYVVFYVVFEKFTFFFSNFNRDINTTHDYYACSFV